MDIALLKESLNLSVVKKTNDAQSASIAYSKIGKKYIGASFQSDTNLLFISSEHAALCRAMQHNDFAIEKIVTLRSPASDTENNLISPVDIKIIIDFARRTNTTIAYSVLDETGRTIFETNDVSSIVPFYKPTPVTLKRTSDAFSENKVPVEFSEEELPALLKKYATLGIARNFPTYDSASGYGTAIITKNNNLYFSGQYSSFEKRTNIHSEMAAPLAAFMDKDYDIQYLGLVSTKYKNEPVNMCGCCRQFLSEMTEKFKSNPKIFCFALETDDYQEFSLDAYLPHKWTSKQW